MAVNARDGLLLGGNPSRTRAAPATRGIADAREVTRRRATTFAAACRLLPPAIRSDVYVLYLVFRTLDDLVDDRRPEAAARVEATSAWAHGRPGELTEEVLLLDALAERYPFPRSAIAAFCEGMRQDLRHEVLITERDVDRYCYRVAGTVGIVMSALLGTDGSPRASTAAAALGMAMQRTNILRDLDEDALTGRTYVARETIARYGEPAPGQRGPLVRDQIARADALYDSGLAGVPALRHGRWAIATAGGMYREILREIERRGYGALPGRTVVPPPRKAAAALRAMRHAW
jgi:phytoene synthase